MKRKKIVSLALASALTLTSVPAGMGTFTVNAEEGGRKIQAEIFVSPDGNDETGDGSYEKPYASLEAARDAVRKINDDMTGDIIVFFAEGDYYFDSTAVFNEEDSGTNGYKVIYRNLDGLGSARFIGGYEVDSEWEAVERTGADADLPAVAEGKVYKTNVGTEDQFNTLYVNDKRATLARTQNLAQYQGYTSALTPYMRSAGGGTGDLVYKAGDLSEEAINGLVNAQKRGDLDASVYMWDGGYWDWMTDTIPFTSIDTENRRLTFKKVEGHPEMYRPKYATRGNARYFLQGNLGFLDVPGEYYFNKTTGDLYYYPAEGSIEEQSIIVPQVKEIIRVEGASKDSKVSNIEFSGLQLSDTDTTDWYAYGWNFNDAGDGLKFYPPEAKGSTQPSYCEQTERIEFQYGNITLKNTDSITVDKLHITNTGMFGLEMYMANTNTVVKDCLINNTGHGGVNIDGGYPGVAGDENGDGYSRDNVVTNSIIHNVGELVGQATGLTVQQSSYNKFSNLEVYNSPRRGVFITAGHSRNPNGQYPTEDFPVGDKNFNIMKDMYSHHNSFDYIYIHDCQQDGGDDGAFFGCYLYKGSKHKPNWINQMVIDSTGANPSMTDLGPNNMNLDMGCSGFVLNNVKSVNPMNFNMEVNTIKQYGDQIEFNNTNIDYGTLKNEIANFDDSKMEYDKIGVTADYPAEYLPEKEAKETFDDVYFEEDFENGLSWNKWAYRGAEPTTQTQWMSEGIFAGRQGLQVKGNSVLCREFTETLNKTVRVKMFDRQNNNLAAYDSGRKNSSKATAFAMAGDGETSVGIGLDKDNMSTYAIQLGDEIQATEVLRTFGWHEFVLDFAAAGTVTLSIDGKEVGTYKMDGFNTVELGADNGYGISYFDELVIYGGEEAEMPGDIVPPTAPEYDGSNDNKELFALDMEEGKDLTDYPLYQNKPVITYENDEELGRVAHVWAPDGSLGIEHGNKDWTNYMVDFKFKFESWGNNNVLGGQYDNFTMRVMTSGSNTSNPDGYQVVLRRNKNGKGQFPAGTPYLEIVKRPGDVSLGTVALPEGFDLNAWHEFQVQSFDGKVGFVLDGQKMLSVNDGALTYGGLMFGGLNCNFYLDDIKITSNPTNAKYPENLGLENARIRGNFNPDFYNYYADITDTTKPVVLNELPTALAGTKISVALNGEAIEAIPAELKLVDGLNKLVFTEDSIAGTTEYVVNIKTTEDAKVTDVEALADVTTVKGVAPELPEKAMVTFADGTKVEAAINWNLIDSALYKKAGTFTAKGVVADYNVPVYVKVTVDGLVSVAALDDVKTTVGTAPELPRTVSAEFGSGAKELALTFAGVPEEFYAKAGTYYVIAEAEGYNGTVLQKVEVKEEELPAVEGYTVTVEGGTISETQQTTGNFDYNAKVTVVADEKEAFTGWKVNGEIVSLKPEYTFYVSNDITLTAVYDEEADVAAKAMLTNVIGTEKDEKYDVKFVGQLVVPEGWRVDAAGLVWSSKDDKELVVDGKLNPELNPTYITTISDTNQFSVTIKGMPAGRFIRGQVFAKLVKDGEEDMWIYSGEDKFATGKAMLTNVTGTEKDEKYDVKFEGELIVPEGWTVEEAGLVWSSKEDKELVIDGKLNPELKPTYIQRINTQNQFSVTIKGMPAGKFLRGKVFAKLVKEGKPDMWIYSAEGRFDSK